MKFFRDNHYLNWGITGFFVAAASMLFYFGIFHMDIIIKGIGTVLQILMPLIYGAVIAYLLNPILNFLEKKVIYPLLASKNRKAGKKAQRLIRYACILLAVFLMCWVVYSLLMTILPEIINSTVNIINSFPQLMDDMQDWATKSLENNPNLNTFVLGSFDKYAVQFENYLTRDILPQLQGALLHLSSGVWDVLVFFKNVVLGVIVSVYILADKETFTAKGKMMLYAFFSTEWANRILENLRFTHRTFGGFIVGKIVDSLIIGLLCYLGIGILKMPYRILISVVVGVTNIIPFFGPYLGAIPCAFLILLVDPLKSLYFLLFILVLQQFDGNILGPKILGESTGLSSFMVILAILVGGGLFGIVGMFVGVPVCAVLYALFWKHIEKALAYRHLPQNARIYETSSYLKEENAEDVEKHGGSEAH